MELKQFAQYHTWALRQRQILHPGSWEPYTFQPHSLGLYLVLQTYTEHFAT